MLISSRTCLTLCYMCKKADILNLYKSRVFSKPDSTRPENLSIVCNFIHVHSQAKPNPIKICNGLSLKENSIKMGTFSVPKLPLAMGMGFTLPATDPDQTTSFLFKELVLIR